MAALFSTTSGVAVVDTRVRRGTITLPLTSQIPNRYLQIKDLYGSFGSSSLTLSTQSGEFFDDGTTSKILTDPFSFFTLYAASTSRWAQLGGTQTIQQTISSLNISSLNGQLPGGLTTTQLVSTTEGLGSAGYISSASFASSLISTIDFISLSFSSFSTAFGPGGGGGINAENINSTVEGLGTAGYISSASLASSLISTIDFISLSFSSFSTAFGPGGGGGINTENLISTVEGLGSSDYVSTLSLYSTMSNWAQYRANSSIFLESGAEFLVTEGGTVTVKQLDDTNGTLRAFKVQIQQNILDAESYLIVKDSFVTGELSTLGLFHSDTNVFENRVAPLYLSSIFLGNAGATVYGEITTDDTATNLYWKGSQLNNQGGVTAEELISTTIGLGTSGYISTGGQGYFSTVFINMLPQDAPFWDSNVPAAGFDPEPNPLALDVFGSVRFLKNVYIGSTTTILGTGAIVSPTVNTTGFSSATVVTSSLGFLNPDTNTPLYLEMSNGNLIFNGSQVVTGSGVTGSELVSTTAALSQSIELNLSSLSTTYGVQFTTSSIVASNVSSVEIAADGVYAQYNLTLQDGGLVVLNNSGFNPTTASFVTSNQNLELAYGLNDAVRWRQTVTNNADYPMSFTFGSNDVFVLDGCNSYVGIFNNTPAYALDVTGTVNATAFIGDGSALTNLPGGLGAPELISTVEGLGTAGYISTGGAGYFSSVGIDIVNPEYRLDVGGTGRFVTLSSLDLNVSSINYPVVYHPQLFLF